MTCPWDKHIFNTKKIQEQLKIDFKLQYKIYLINHKSKPHAGRNKVNEIPFYFAILRPFHSFLRAPFGSGTWP